MAQRIRRIRGTIQTTIVNSRAPFRMSSELGARNFFLTQIMSSVSLIVALAHPLFILWVASSVVLLLFGLPSPSRLWLFLQSLYVIVAAFAFLAATVAAMRTSLFLGRGAWITTILTLPVYWLLVSMASWAALLQYFWGVASWTKTPHGVSRVKPQVLAEKKSEKKSDTTREKKPRATLAGIQAVLSQPRPTKGI